jgi:hypothetical protein
LRNDQALAENLIIPSREFVCVVQTVQKPVEFEQRKEQVL